MRERPEIGDAPAELRRADGGSSFGSGHVISLRPALRSCQIRRFIQYYLNNTTVRSSCLAPSMSLSRSCSSS